MSYQVLARKWRPRRFEDVVGQEHVLKALVNALVNQRLHHAYLFTGTRGVGKTTLARIFAKALNCQTGITATPCGSCAACTEIDSGRFVDLIEVDAASRTKVEDTRDLLDNVQYAPTAGRYKVYLIDEVHMLSTNSFNALLKTLEEPPPHVKFLLATTDPQKLPVTVLSRCLQFNLKRLSSEAIAGHLARVLEAERVSFEPAALKLVARAADGSVRDALSLLDQAIAYGAGEVKEGEVNAMLGTLERGEVYGLLDALAAQDGAALLNAVDRLSQGTADFKQVLETLLSALHHVAVLQTVGDGFGDGDEALQALSKGIPPEDIQLYYQIGVLGARDLPYSPDGRTALEMTLLRMLAFRPRLDQTQSRSPGSLDEVVAAPRPATSAPTLRAAQPAMAESKPAQRTTFESRLAEHKISEHKTPPPVAAPTVPRQEVVPAPPIKATTTDWPAVVRLLKLDGFARQLAANCAAEQCSAESVKLTLATAHASFHNQKVEQRLKEALSDYFGAPVSLSIRIGEPVAETPAEQQARATRQRQVAAQEEIENDGTVRAMLETFNGQIIPDSVRPVDGRE